MEADEGQCHFCIVFVQLYPSELGRETSLQFVKTLILVQIRLWQQHGSDTAASSRGVWEFKSSCMILLLAM